MIEAVYLRLRLERLIVQEAFRDVRAFGIRLKIQLLQPAWLMVIVILKIGKTVLEPSEHQRFSGRLSRLSSRISKSKAYGKGISRLTRY